jgi:hypothetical protein
MRPPPEKKKKAPPPPEQPQQQSVDAGFDPLAHERQIPNEGVNPWAKDEDHNQKWPVFNGIAKPPDAWTEPKPVHVQTQPAVQQSMPLPATPMHFQQQQANAPPTQTWSTPVQPQHPAVQTVQPEAMGDLRKWFQSMSIEQRAQAMTMMGIPSNQQGNGASSAASATMPPLAGQEPAYID